MAAPTDNKGLDLAPDGGSLQTTTIIAVQQSGASGIIQKMSQPSMAQNTAITGQGFDDESKFVTPKGLGLTVSSTSDKGIVKLASNLNIENKAEDNALTSSKMDKIFDEGIKQTGTLSNSDIDGATQGTVIINSIRGVNFGNLMWLGGQFTYQPNASEEKRSLYFINIKVPIQYTAIGAQYERSDKLGLKLPMTIGIEDAGADRIRMDINTEGEGINWTVGTVYTIDFSITYLQG